MLSLHVELSFKKTSKCRRKLILDDKIHADRKIG